MSTRKAKATTTTSTESVTALVIYTHQITRDAKKLRQMKRYAFNIIPGEFSVGDLIKCDAYETPVQVVEVLDAGYKYYNSSTGELANKITSTAQREIVSLRKGTPETEVVYGVKLNK